jgi:hypothetical protein
MTEVGSVALPFLALPLPFVVLWIVIWSQSQKLGRYRDHALFLGNAAAVLIFIGLGSWLREAGYEDIFAPAIVALICNGILAVAMLRPSGRNADK